MAKDKTKKKALGPKAVGPKPKKTPCDKLELDDEAEWAELEKDAMSAERFDAIAEYLRSSGQASA